MNDQTDIEKNAQGLDEETSPHLSDATIKTISEAIDTQDERSIYKILNELSIADTAELISKIKDDERQELISIYNDAIPPEVFADIDQKLIKLCLPLMPASNIAEIIAQLESDDALLLIEALEPDFQTEIINKLSSKMRLALKEGLNFPEDSAGRLMRRELVSIPEFWTVGKTLDYLRKAANTLPEDFFDIFIIDTAHHVTGELPLSHLVRASRSDKISNLKSEQTHPIPAEMDQEQVAHMFRRDNIVSAPVVDEDKRLIGVITIDDIVDVIDEEAQEDILRLAGVEHGDLYHAVISTTGMRFRWLFINLLTALLASLVISFFGATIEQVVALAVLMPVVASMGGNAGTQALTIAVRAIATHEISDTNTWRIIWKETLVGTLNGIMFAVLTGVLAGLCFQSYMLGIVIALAMIINMIVAGMCGAGIPILLNKLGSDPAVSSTVILTTVTDVVGFFSFLGLASILLV